MQHSRTAKFISPPGPRNPLTARDVKKIGMFINGIPGFPGGSRWRWNISASNCQAAAPMNMPRFVYQKGTILSGIRQVRENDVRPRDYQRPGLKASFPTDAETLQFLRRRRSKVPTVRKASAAAEGSGITWKFAISRSAAVTAFKVNASRSTWVKSAPTNAENGIE